MSYLRIEVSAIGTEKWTSLCTLKPGVPELRLHTFDPDGTLGRLRISCARDYSLVLMEIFGRKDHGYKPVSATYINEQNNPYTLTVFMKRERTILPPRTLRLTHCG